MSAADAGVFDAEMAVGSGDSWEGGWSAGENLSDEGSRTILTRSVFTRNFEFNWKLSTLLL